MQEFVSSGDVQLLGVIQEQHPERCRLFAQWHQIDWPILHDPVNRIPALAVPIVIAIDEHGVVRSTGPQPDWVKNEFLRTDYPAPPSVVPPATKPDLEALQKRARAEGAGGQAWADLAEATVIWGGPQRLNMAIKAYDRAIEMDAKIAHIRFGRGVALRMRYESRLRRDTDFQDAVDAWGAALEINPNHYIYRRRIQQYGPRLMKPYPFYDWVAKARAEIRARGEQPVKLPVEPGGAEIATPSRTFTAGDAAAQPDAAGRIHRDTRRFVKVNSVTVPSKIEPGKTARIHLEFRVSRQTHWNNETEPVQVWIHQPDGWQLDRSLFTLKQDPRPESTETRRLELEARLPSNVSTKKLSGYALYYVCEEAGGQCLYLRQDFEIPIQVASQP